MKTTALIADPLCKDHVTGLGHPERPARFDAALGAVEKAGLLTKLARLEPREVADDDLFLAHTARYVRLAKEDIFGGAPQLSTGDTSVSRSSWEPALCAVGSGLAAVEAVVGGKAANAFCIVRPPGHHASAARGMGFCVLNNIALAARFAQRRLGIGKVLIVDWDVHHGNGTQDIFYEDGSVFFFSTHQSPWYPGTGAAEEIGAGAGRGTTLNCPLPAMSGPVEIGGAFERELLPAMEKFRPELVLISAGFDSRVGDPLGHFLLADADFGALTRLVRGIADRHAGGRLVSMLEGGYSLEGVGSAAAAHVAALLE